MHDKIMPKSRTRAILISAATFTALSLLPKLLVVAKDVAVAFYFGAGQALDIYLMAFTLIGMPVLVIVVALQTALIPALVSQQKEVASGLLGGALKLALCISLFVLPVWLLLLPDALDAFYPASVKTIRSSLLLASYWLIPYYFLNGINILMYGALQARKTFWVNAILPGVFPVAIILSLVVTQQVDVRTLLIGTNIGSLIECVVLYMILIRIEAIRLRGTRGSGLRPVLVSALPLMIGVIAGALAPMVEQVVAFKLGSGSVSLLSYGNKVPNAVNTLLVTAIGIVMLPHFVDLVSAERWRESRTLHWKLAGSVFAFGVVVSAMGILFSEDLIRLLFERGAFTATDSKVTANVMSAYLFQLPFLLVAMLSTRALAAMRKTKTLTLVAIVQLLLVSALAYIFSRHFGVAGVPLGSLVATVVGASLLSSVAWRHLSTQHRCQMQ